MSRVASIGECMIELRQAQGNLDVGLYSRGFGGDTLNTAVYLARLGIDVDYITALGDDSLSDEMIAGWQAEGVGTAKVPRLKGKLPGIYMIETNEGGERRFFHWRDSAAARELMDLPQTSAREQGARIVFDTNFRARGWRDRDDVRAAFEQAFTTSDIVLASTEDMLPVYPDETDEQLIQRVGRKETILKLLDPGSIVSFEGALHRVTPEPVTDPVVDTTAAGDSFAAAYVAARLGGASPVDAARAGDHLAGVVVCYAGAIIPRSAMPAKTASNPRKALR